MIAQTTQPINTYQLTIFLTLTLCCIKALNPDSYIIKLTLLRVHYPGPEEELGSAAPRVPGPLTRHRHHVEEVPQGAPGSGDEAARD